MEKRIKFRLFHFYEEVAVPGDTSKTMLVERYASFGQTADISREEDIARGEKLGAFFSDEESQAIEDGTYRGPAYDQLRSNAGNPGEGSQQALGAGTPDISGMSDEQIAELIQNGNDGQGLNVAETVALAGNDKDLAEKVLDAEIIASESDPRKGVEKGLEAIISRANSQPPEEDN